MGCGMPNIDIIVLASAPLKSSSKKQLLCGSTIERMSLRKVRIGKVVGVVVSLPVVVPN